MNAFERLLDRLREDGKRVVEHSGRTKAQCPAHADRNPSLSIRQIEGSVLLHCHGGCHVDDVLAALGMGKADLFDDPKGARYDYLDATGRDIVRTVTRSPEKAFRQAVREMGTVSLFRLPQVVEAVSRGQTIYLVEGEKDVLALEAIGMVATTAPMGASNFAKVNVAPLAGAKVVAIVDKDEAGKKWATKVKDLVPDVTFVEALVGKDAADHIAAGHGIDDFVQLDLVVDQEEDKESGPRLFKASELQGSRQLDWLATKRIPKAAVTILVGDEGIGKSLLWVWVVAALTTGQALPEFGIPARNRPLNVLLIITEDEWSTTVRPRLELAGADLEYITVICTEDDGSGSPVFPRDMHLVYEADPDLVVVDAFADTVDGRLSLKDPQQARLALHPWKEAATRTGAAVMLLTHTNRMDSKSARDKYGLTAELRKKARMTLYAQQDEDGFLVVGPEKSNIVGPVPASKFTILAEQVFAATDDSDGTVPVLVWVADSDKTARQHIEDAYVAAHEDPEDVDDRTAAERWLEDYLTENPGAPSKTAKEDARRQAGISDRTLKRAANKLGVIVGEVGFPRQTTWTLPDSEASRDTTAPHVSEGGPTGPTGPTDSDKGKQDQQESLSGQSGQSGHIESNGPAAVPTGVPTAVTPIARCVTCGKHLKDQESIERGDCGNTICQRDRALYAGDAA